MTSKEIRQSFLAFFEQRGHQIVPSAPVIPAEDPTLIFTNAGMNQFKDVFLGTGRRSYSRAADTQKCIRVSGKHNDLEEVGRDTYHHTFFEMLGNWSFGDYYKEEAIRWAWELLTDVWGLEKKRLYATVYETDDESADLWRRVTDIDPTHIIRFGKKDNFWEMGETGPCGPCSEIHFDLTPDGSGGPLVNAGDPRVMEIWNLVFIQYNRDEKGELHPLPAKHVDTGMGFERVCAVLQGKSSNYDTDVFMPIINRIADVVGKPYGSALDSPADIAMRVIADHVRMLSFSIADGGIPSNEGRGYVMRRLLRRAARFGRNLGMREPFIYHIVDAVSQTMGEQFPEVLAKQAHIERVIKAEEESFNATLDRGLEIFQTVIERIGHSKTFPGEDAFKLYDTYGFPLDLTEMMARESGLAVDNAGFMELMNEQRQRSRSATSSGSSTTDNDELQIGVQREAAKRFDTAEYENGFRFIGYESLKGEASVLSSSGNLLVLDSTPFYAESGGQVGDQGYVEIDDQRFVIRDTQKSGSVNVHILVSSASLPNGAKVWAEVDATRRLNIMCNHTATHIVHEALRRVLGQHLHQHGSLVSPDHLRFDFNHFERVQPDELKAIEDIVNEKIADNIPVLALNDPKDWLTIDEAKKRYPNVKMFFGDKYGDRVRIVEVDPKFSVELCGGTHVAKTTEIGPFKIISEGSVASGIRRIVAATGDGLRRHVIERLEKIGELDRQLEKLLEETAALEKEMEQREQVAPTKRPKLNVPVVPAVIDQRLVEDVMSAEREWAGAVESLTRKTNDLRKKLGLRRVQQATDGIESLVESAMTMNGISIISARVNAQSMEELKSMGDALRSKIGTGVGVLASVVDDKVSLVCVVSDDLIKEKKLQAGKIVGELAKLVGGGGGGRPHLATAGGKDVSKLDETLAQTPTIIQSMLK